jgi:hypothetical protein
MPPDFFQSELTWALAMPCSAETEGKTSPVFYAKLLASAVLLGSCVQRKTVRTCSSICFSDRQAPCCDMAAPVVVPPVAVCVCLARLLAVWGRPRIG